MKVGPNSAIRTPQTWYAVLINLRNKKIIDDETIDAVLLASISSEWRKVAFVIGKTMLQIDNQERVGKDDLYFAERVAVLAERGLIEHQGPLEEIRKCEVRLVHDSTV